MEQGSPRPVRKSSWSEKDQPANKTKELLAALKKARANKEDSNKVPIVPQIEWDDGWTMHYDPEFVRET